MRYRALGQSGLEASVVGLGTWAIGGWMWGGTDERAAVAAVQAAIDAGVNLLDTAPAYGLGRSEELVGQAIAGRRDKVILATKCGLVWHTRQGTYYFDQDGRPVHRFLGPDSIRYELERSLARLGTDTVDLYQTHWQDSTTAIEDTMACLMDLQAAGKIRAIGVSNVTVPEVEAYRAAGAIAGIQERYSMIDRCVEGALLPYCRDHGLAVLAYAPLASGLLTGSIGPERVFSGDDLRRDHPRFARANLERAAALLAEVRPIADVHRATVGQTVTAWTLAQPGLTHVLCGARSPEQAIENAAAGDLELTGDELSRIDDALRRHGPGIV